MTYQQQWDAENRLTVVTNTLSGDVTRFVYDGDGARVLQLRSDGSQTAYVGGLMEIDIAAPATPTPTNTPAATPGDDFNRADSTNLGSKWDERAGDWHIVSNTLHNKSTGGDIVTSYNGGPYANVAVTSKVYTPAAAARPAQTCVKRCAPPLRPTSLSPGAAAADSPPVGRRAQLFHSDSDCDIITAARGRMPCLRVWPLA